MNVVIVTGYFKEAEKLGKELHDRGHEYEMFFRDYHFETFVKGIAPTIDRSVPKVDLVITDGTCKTRDKYCQSCLIGYSYPREWATEHSIPVASFRQLRIALWFNRNFGLTGLKLMGV